MGEWSNVYYKDIKGKGLTLFAKRDLKKGEEVLTIAGPVVSEPTTYTIPISLNLYIDPVPNNGPAKYLCHDCEPNMGVKNRTQLIALRDIAKDEEVAIDYAMIGYEYGDELPEAERKCRCYKPTCRGELGSWKKLPLELKTKYRPYVSDYLLKIDHALKIQRLKKRV